MEHDERDRGTGAAGAAGHASPREDAGGAGTPAPPAEDVRAAFTPTGDHAVDAALGVLDDLPTRPVREHVAVFEAVHGALSDRLAESRE